MWERSNVRQKQVVVNRYFGPKNKGKTSAERLFIVDDKGHYINMVTTVYIAFTGRE